MCTNIAFKCSYVINFDNSVTYFYSDDHKKITIDVSTIILRKEIFEIITKATAKAYNTPSEQWETLYFSIDGAKIKFEPYEE